MMINKCDGCIMLNCCDEFTDCGCTQVIEYGKEIEQKVRADVIDKVERELLANGFIFTEHALEVWNKIAEQLKEKK